MDWKNIISGLVVGAILGIVATFISLNSTNVRLQVKVAQLEKDIIKIKKGNTTPLKDAGEDKRILTQTKEINKLDLPHVSGCKDESMFLGELQTLSKETVWDACEGDLFLGLVVVDREAGKEIAYFSEHSFGYPRGFNVKSGRAISVTAMNVRYKVTFTKIDSMSQTVQFRIKKT